MNTLTQQDKELMLVAEKLAELSPDIHTKVGCVISTDSQGHIQGAFNRFPNGIAWTIDRAQRPAKYKYTLHAETLCIMQALYLGYPLEGASLYSTQIPCAPICALLIIESGIKRVVTKPFSTVTLQKWTDELGLVMEMFAEADVDLIIEDSKEKVQ